eukprot:INCI2807.1.p1 GENE.INCI2807.1~~INCI2807.1.p1  ORF type:complete len:439 (-),score=56.39 INCI2807.1:65-1381(-)
MPTLSWLLPWLVVGCAARAPWVAAAVSPEMPLTVLTDEQGKDRGAVCLDGSNPGFYHRAAPQFASASIGEGSQQRGDPNPHLHDWVVYFKGGGWCYNEKDCAQRAKTELGSSTHFPKTFGFSGVVDPDPTVNPDFADFNHVIFFYCDGASFSGNASEPVKVDGADIYFRGRVVLDALLDAMDTAPYNLRNATSILVAGGSAGGLSTYLHADYIAERYKATGTEKVAAAPVSGFFLMHHDYNSTATTYRDEMQYVFNMTNAEGGVNQNCVAAQKAAGLETWPCIFANYSYAHAKTPFFLLQSAVDSWQAANIWKHSEPCFKNQFVNCTEQDMEDLNSWEHDFLHDLQSTEKFSRDGEGGFVESCFEHVALQSSSPFERYSLNGTIARDALAKWWNSGFKDPSHHHFYLPCSLNVHSEPHQCNPTCLSAAGSYLGEDSSA